ncbi:MAG: 30S ribosomal protein S6 [Desulfobacterales bacterium]|nr:30S ribosomal protein S6 [Desulfobacterales bacterium]
MRRYETFIILDPDLSAEQRVPVVERVKDIMAQMGGFLIRIDEWGSRKLAYTIAQEGARLLRALRFLRQRPDGQ